MNIAILDDYQDQVRTLGCVELLRDHNIKVFNSSARGLGQLAVRLAPFDALVLISERTQLSGTLLRKLPWLKLISQTGKVSGLPNVLATPHIGYVERDSYERYFEAAFRNIVAFANGSPVNLLNPEVLSEK